MESAQGLRFWKKLEITTSYNALIYGAILRYKQIIGKVSLKLHTELYPRPFFFILWTSFTPQVMKMLILIVRLQ